ncbi:MAG: sulfoxide reductase heme-binding subunit YedZ [Methylophilaceae bacterium]|nr:sulfoxide reductase heme-binding subunit YedZ [Methylophilaceae bacterium]
MLPAKIALNWLRYLKGVVFLLALLPLARLLVLGVLDRLGANPVEFVLRSNGTSALTLLLATLAITPLQRWSGAGWLLALRRMLGLFAFFYAVLHVLSYVWLDQWFDWHAIAQDVMEHRYLLVGLLAFLLLIPLALTSTDGMMRRLGNRWRPLHRLVYLAGGLGVVHYLWLVKKDLTLPLAYGVVLGLLLAARLYPARRRSDVMPS